MKQAYSRNALKSFKQVDIIEEARQVCAILQETKNLDSAAIENKPAAGVIPQETLKVTS